MTSTESFTIAPDVHVAVLPQPRQGADEAAAPDESSSEANDAWVAIAIPLFQRGSGSARAAQLLLSRGRMSKQTLAVEVGVEPPVINRVVARLGGAGFAIQQWKQGQRIQYLVVDHRSTPQGIEHLDAPPAGFETDDLPALTPRRQDTSMPGRPRTVGIGLLRNPTVSLRSQERGLICLEVSGHGDLYGRFLGPSVPTSLLNGTAQLRGIIVRDGGLDLQIGDETALVRFRLG